MCADVFHLVKLVGDALDDVRRQLWNDLRRLPDDRWAKASKGSRWCLLKNPEDLTDTQAAQLARIRRTRGSIWRAYEMKEQFRAIFAGDLDPADAVELLDRWIARDQRCRLPAFVKAARTMRDRRGLIVNAFEHGISNGRIEGLNTKVRLIVRRAYGFHFAEAALDLVMLACGPSPSPCPTNNRLLTPPHDPHHRQDGVWAGLLVRTGALRFVFEDDPGNVIDLAAGTSQVISPGRLHHVDIAGPVHLHSRVPPQVRPDGPCSGFRERRARLDLTARSRRRQSPTC